MNQKPIIKVNNVTMDFRLQNEKVNSIKEYMIRILKRKLTYSNFRALDNVSFNVYKGERLGIIGRNGAGKSTLLKIISGVMKPTSGSVEINGSIAPLLELGAGFDQEFSGAKNIYLNGAILGKDKAFLDANYERIVEFSELGHFIHTPLKNYSSGMRAKLGFSIASQVGADILIVDEVLGVGDEAFKAKSSAKMREMMDGGGTVLIVSHSLQQIRELSDRVIWIDGGKVVEIGKADVICTNYQTWIKKNRIKDKKI